jgi:UDP-N-acetylmuramoyl-L-alanyl-D-glutamate--2,6-diaminopimelate ligase
MPKLSELLDCSIKTPFDRDILSITADSRSVSLGSLFAALPGSRHHGSEFIEEAIAKGASAILIPKGTPYPQSQAYVIESENPRQTFAKIVSAFYPERPRFLAAVTGTNGKTSVAHFTRQLWTKLGYKAGAIGTIGIQSPSRNESGSLTTPNPIDLHRILSEFKQDSITHAVFEASSHGLDQGRLDGLHVQAAGFTNLTRDHLDYHGSMEAYWKAKTHLFTSILSPWGTLVFNADSPMMVTLPESLYKKNKHSIFYGNKGRDLTLIKSKAIHKGQEISLNVFGTPYHFIFPLVGQFQLENALCALGLVIGCGAEERSAVQALESLEGVPGRLELVCHTKNQASLYIDYAHTPDALKTILESLRPHVEGKLCLVFGCGGDRDKGKRPIMGQIANDLADKIWITDDNPRTENADLIRQEIASLCSRAHIIADRQKAIRLATQDLQKGDILIVAGKGHEKGQIIGTSVYPFDDKEECQKAVEIYQ